MYSCIEETSGGAVAGGSMMEWSDWTVEWSGGAGSGVEWGGGVAWSVMEWFGVEWRGVE